MAVEVAFRGSGLVEVLAEGAARTRHGVLRPLERRGPAGLGKRVGVEHREPIRVGVGDRSWNRLRASTYLRSYLYGVGPWDARALLLTLAAAAALAFAASLWPVRRASRTDPLTAFRCDQGNGEHVAAFSVQRLPVRSCTSTQREPFFTNRKCSGRPVSRPLKGTPSAVRG